MYITADRNTLLPNSRKLKILALISIDFAHVVSKLWSIVILAKKKKTTFGVWEVSFFSFYNNFLFTPKDTPTQNKITFFIDFNWIKWLSVKFVINFVFALFPPDFEDLQAIHQETFSLLTFWDTHTSDSYFMYFAKFYWINYANLWWL